MVEEKFTWEYRARKLWLNIWKKKKKIKDKNIKWTIGLLKVI